MKNINGLVAISLFVVSVFALLVSRNVVLAVNDNKVTICHATDSDSNPYVSNQPNKSGDVSGHDDHDGPVWFDGIDGKWGDIIPPFTYGDGQVYPGKNWNASGIAIYNNGCNVPSEVVIPTITNTPTPTPTIPVECDGECFPQATPTPTTGGDVIIGNIDPCFRNGCPTATPTPTVAPTATPTPTDTPSQGGTGGGSSDGGSSSSNSSSNSSNNGSVQGATTTLASTGVFSDTLMNMVGLAGVMLTGLSAVRYGKKS